MLKIIERSPEKLVLEKTPIVFYALCAVLLVSGVIGGILVSASLKSLGYIIGVVSVSGTVALLFYRGETTLIWINKKSKVLYYGKRGVFTVRTKKFHFSEIDRITLSRENDTEQGRGRRCGIILENAAGLKKRLLYFNDRRLARQTSELLKTYLSYA